ncbi:MAG TPA: DUF6504 family protein [Ktedonobacterales bacterium]|jgi:hypothetical protein|nr:DUF6504 family protein [Ktedonobacterales bacterium]
MTHAYYRPIHAWHSQPDDDISPPSAFIWRDERYEVLDVWAEWHLMDRWWEPPEIPGVRQGFSDRIYHRLRAKAVEFDVKALHELDVD